MSRSAKTITRWVGLSLALAIALTGCGKGCAKKDGGAKGAMELIPADRNVLIGINWKSIQSSPLGAKLKESMPPDVSPLLQDIDSMVVGLNAQAIGQKEPNVLAIIDGKVDEAKMLEEMKKQATKEGVALTSEDYSGVKLHTNAKKPEIVVAFLGNKALVGNKDAVMKAIDLSNKKGESIESNKTIMDLVGRVDKGKMLWAVATIPPGAIPGGAADPGNPMAALKNLKAIDVSVDYGDNLVIDLALQSSNPEEAKQVATMANSYKTLAGGSLASQDPAFGKVLNGLTIDAKEDRIVLNLKVDKATVEEISKKGPAALMGGGMGAGGPPMGDPMGGMPPPSAPDMGAPPPPAPPAPDAGMAPAPAPVAPAPDAMAPAPAAPAPAVPQ